MNEPREKLTRRKPIIKTAPLIAALAALGSIAAAAEPTIVVDKAGRHYYSAGDGSAAIEVKNVVRLPGATPPTDPDDPDPPTPGDDVAADVAKAARAIGEPLFAKAMALTYRETAKAVASGQVKPGQVPAKLEEATDRWLLMLTIKDAQWKLVVKLVESHADATLDGNSTPEEWAVFLARVADGFEAGADDAKIEDWEQWLPLLLMILRLILGLG